MQPGQPDLQMIMQQAQKMQEQLIAAQAELAVGGGHRAGRQRPRAGDHDRGR